MSSSGCTSSDDAALLIRMRCREGQALDLSASEPFTSQGSERPRWHRQDAHASSLVGGNMSNASCDIGLIGLAVMGQNLVLNMNDHGYKVAVFNRTVSKVDDFINNEAKGTQVVGTYSMADLAQSLKRPRRVMLMVKAGDTIDQMIESLLPHLEQGDIIIDGGNSHWP